MLNLVPSEAKAGSHYLCTQLFKLGSTLLSEGHKRVAKGNTQVRCTGIFASLRSPPYASGIHLSRGWSNMDIGPCAYLQAAHEQRALQIWAAAP
eukprot:294115-Pelagomonas_calceolata.AAC.4